MSVLTKAHWTIALGAMIWGANAPIFAAPQALPQLENFMSDHRQPVAGDGEFVSVGDAEAYLTRTLPPATAANPKYRGEKEGTATRWLTKAVKFRPGAAPHGILIAMDEEAIEFRDGVETGVVSHDVEFSIE